MVFSGRPSTACHACRPKRLKCDRVQSGCTQCARKGIKCPGYRDASLLRLRNDTDRIAQKVMNAQNRQKLRQPSTSDKATERTPLSTPQTTGLSYAPIVPSPTPDVNGIAITYFMSSYLVSSSFESYLADLYLASPHPNDALSSAICAASLATFGLRFGHSRSINIASQNYSAALRKTNCSLEDPQSAILDRTLAAVLLLGLYEAVVFRGGQSPTSWTAHTFGAMDLLQLRGVEQFKTKLAKQLFAQASNNIRTSCIQRSVAIPNDFLVFTGKARPYLDQKDPAIRLEPIVNKVAYIRARYANSPDLSLLRDALHLDREIIAFTECLEQDLRYIPRSKEETPSWAYLNIASRYPSLRVVRFWNAIRMLRIFLLTFVWDGISARKDTAQLDFPVTPDLDSDNIGYLEEYARNNMIEVTNGVLASVPDFIEPEEYGDRFSPPARTLIWPLSLLQTSPLCPLMAKMFARSCLEKLARDLNMPQAMHPDKKPGSEEDW